MLWSLLYYVLAIAGVLVQCQSTSSQTFWPAAVPLAVRSPYLNTWVATLNGTTPLDIWPNFWNDRNVSVLLSALFLYIVSTLELTANFQGHGLDGLRSS
jgi:hypothetical protein